MVFLELFDKYWVAIVAVFGPIGTYLVGRNTRVTEAKIAANTVQGGELLNVQDALGIYRGMLEDLKKKLDEVNNMYSELETKFSTAVQKVRAYEKKIEIYELKITSLDNENKALIKQINSCPVPCAKKKTATI